MMLNASPPPSSLGLGPLACGFNANDLYFPHDEDTLNVKHKSRRLDDHRGSMSMEERTGPTEPKTRPIKVKISDNKFLTVEAMVIGDGEEQVGVRIPDFAEVTDAVEGIVDALAKTLKKVKPARAAVEFGVVFGIESGALTAMVVKGTGEANLKIMLELTGANPSVGE